jgi:hypothetical protein
MKKTKEVLAKEAEQRVKEQEVAQQLIIEEKVRERFPKFDDWKKEHAPRKLSVIVVDDKMAILRPIGASEVATFSMMMVNPELGLDKASEFLLAELWIDGDEDIRSDEEYFISAMLQLQNIIELKKSNFYRL